jgi:hypothetical protein
MMPLFPKDFIVIAFRSNSVVFLAIIVQRGDQLMRVDNPQSAVYFKIIKITLNSAVTPSLTEFSKPIKQGNNLFHGTQCQLLVIVHDVQIQAPRRLKGILQVGMFY